MRRTMAVLVGLALVGACEGKRGAVGNAGSGGGGRGGSGGAAGGARGGMTGTVGRGGDGGMIGVAGGGGSSGSGSGGGSGGTGAAGGALGGMTGPVGRGGGGGTTGVAGGGGSGGDGGGLGAAGAAGTIGAAGTTGTAGAGGIGGTSGSGGGGSPDAGGDATDAATGNDAAALTGEMFGPTFVATSGDKTILDGAPSGTAVLAYPLDHALLPPNLSPLEVQIPLSFVGRSARLAFRGTGIDLNYYASCDARPGTGCVVTLPQTLTRLFIAPSELGDIRLTARITSGTAPVETQTVDVAWPAVALTGGLDYWSTIPNPPRKTTGDNLPTPPNYILLDPTGTNGSGIFRYAFTNDGRDPMPDLVWTDDGSPTSAPPYIGAPQSWGGATAGSHCIGCHTVSNDGRYMAMTIGGSDSTFSANFALLDLRTQSLIEINPRASSDPASSPTSNPTDYWKKFRQENLATVSSWGPRGDRLVSMFKSKLYLTELVVTGATGTATRIGTVVPTWQAREPYAADPFWSRDGQLFVFTSFAQPSLGLYNETGLNGDMKKGGQIVIASADADGVHDDARVLISRVAGATSYGPNTSDDSALVAFSTSLCGSDPDLFKSATDYGNQSCDGYDDASAKLWVVRSDGGAASPLSRANGAGSSYANAWPRFAPTHGTFRGQQLYWIAFSSRRPYGIQINNGGASVAAKPQIWLAAIVVAPGLLPLDPSYAPVWLPSQNRSFPSAQGNHTPQWSGTVVPPL